MPKAKKTQLPAASVQTGDGGVGIGGNVANSTIITGPTVIQPPAPAPEIHDTIGFIPPFKGETYVHRGKIEDDVRQFLKNGGTGAIVGLHAPGGLGKTELAKHASEDLKGNFEGVLWIDVGEKKPHQVIGDMLMKCGVQSQPGASYEQQRNELQHVLKEHCFLIVLDDVREAALAGLADYLPPKPCSVLITSRIQQIGGVNRTFALDHLTEAQAKQLLDAILGKDVVNAEKETAEKLAARCAFNPLALEIAARRIRQLQGINKPIARYFEMAQARFEQLKMEGDQRWNMEFIFDLSYNDLSPEDQKRFRALAVFAPTGFSPAAAAHLWGLDESGAGEVLSRFQNLSLALPVKGDFIRYRLHDLLDEYAEGKLKKDKEEERQAHNALAEWLVALFDEHYTDDPSNAPEVAMEIDNLKKSAEWAISEKDAGMLAYLATRPRNWLFNVFREWDAWRDWLEQSLRFGIDDSDKEGKQLKANVRKAIGDVQQFRKEMDAALESYHEALNLFRQVGAKLGEANVLLEMSRLELRRGELEKAKTTFEKIVAMRRLMRDIFSEGRDYYYFARTLIEVDQKKEAKPYALKAKTCFEQVGEKFLVEYAEKLIEACDE